MLQRFATALLVLAGSVGLSSAAHALTVTQPTSSTVVPAGDDYATQVLGNPWDMADAADIDTEDSFAVTSQAFSSGIFSGTTTGNGAFVYPLFMGFASSINLSRGANHPIDTTHYRYVTYKLRVDQATQPQFSRVIALLDGGSYGASPKATIVESTYTPPLPSNTWLIVRFDMVNASDGVFYQWTDFPQLTGLRIDPATTNVSGPYANAPFAIDWVRLTAPATAAQQTAVQWVDSGYSGTYDVFAIDGDGASVQLGSNIGGTSFLADTSILPPGPYQIRVVRTVGGTSALSATFRINSPPQITLTAPNIHGDTARAFAPSVVGNPWGPIDAGDFAAVLNFTNVNYNTPPGSFYGRPTNNDPGWILNLGGHTIDTSLYRSLCFTLEVFGPRQVGLGSVARLFWGNSPSQLTTSKDIPLDDNLGDTTPSEYCIADLAAVPLESNPLGGGWSGSKSVLRLDPDEFTPPLGCNTPDTCHDVRLDSVVLAPFASANPGYTFTWSVSDPDDTAVMLRLALDPDTTPGNGNEFVIGNLVVGNGNGSFAWSGSPPVPSGTYHVLATVDDGRNPVNQYAGGVLLVTSDRIFANGFE